MDTPAIGPIRPVGDTASGPAQHGIDSTSDSELYRAMREAMRWREQEGRQRQRRQEPAAKSADTPEQSTGQPDSEGHVEFYL